MQSTNKSDNISISNTNNSLHGELPQFIQNFCKIDIKEIEPTTQNINKSIYEDLSPVIDELADLYFKAANKGKEENVRKQHILDHINNYELNLQDIYNWLLNTQNNSNSIFLLGYFNFYGIGININKQKSYKLYKKAVELENIVAQLVLADIYIHGKGLKKNSNKAFELAKELAKKEYLAGINMLGYCYGCGVGTNINMEKAFKLYQKAANSGNSIAQYNIALLYEYGKGIGKDVDQAIYWYKKSAEQGYHHSQNKLEVLN
jgi:TPR repeat protein